MTRIRTVLAAVPVVATIGLSAPPAHASLTGQFSLLLDMPQAGVPGSHGGGVLHGTFSGLANGNILNGASVSGSFTYEMPTFPCPVQTVAAGSMTITGAGTVDFSYQRDVAVFTLATSDGSEVVGVTHFAGGTPCSASAPAVVEAADGAGKGP